MSQLHFILYRENEITIEDLCPNFVRYFPMEDPSLMLIHFICSVALVVNCFRRFFNLSFSLSTVVLWDTHCWDVIFVFTSNVLFISILLHTWLNRDAYNAAVVLFQFLIFILRNICSNRYADHSKV